MSFATGYLASQAIRERLIGPPPDPGCGMIVAIPAFNEPGLIRCLESLQNCSAPPVGVEVHVFFNAPAEADGNMLEQNRESQLQMQDWCRRNVSSPYRFFSYLENLSDEKSGGVGLARKILMDEAVRRFDQIGRPEGIILSLDADTLVSRDYLQAVYRHFTAEKNTDGCSVYFEHPIQGMEYPDDIYNAIASYELHQRYYLHAVRYTGYPFAFHTVGSAFAVKAVSYVRMGGMNRRQGGEDFYFIQKLANTGRFSECREASVFPSPRPSDRVPFGTGPAVRRLIQGEEKVLLTPPFSSFRRLRDLFVSLSASGDGGEISSDPLVSGFLDSVAFREKIAEIRSNTASEKSFNKRFFQWFDMLMILRFLHYLRDQGIADRPVQGESISLLEQVGYKVEQDTGIQDLLGIFRKIDREGLICR
ncbi:MAG: glycosyltransferase family 2 protein [Bacteroidota bacterium]